MKVLGRRYLLRGEPVTVVIAPRRVPGAPWNVCVEYDDGRRVVRPFRGLRRPREGS